MMDKAAVIEKICGAFAGTEFPGAAFLQGTFEGCEPYEEVGPFQSRPDWRNMEADFLDGHANALCFFSEGGFRFFLPAYLLADLNDQLHTANPVFHLTHGFTDTAVKVPVQDRQFPLKTGRTLFINPRRYGAATFYDYVRFRLSVFTREEAGAIVAYLRFKRDFDPSGNNRETIEAALQLFWLGREQTAPSAEELRQYLAEQAELLAATASQTGQLSPTPPPAASRCDPHGG